MPWGWQAAASPTLALGWHHIVGVSDGAAKLLYVNGVLAATNPGTDLANFAGPNATAAVTTDTMTIGRQAETGARYWQGDLDEVRLATVARSANWIRLEYENQKENQNFIGPLTAPTVSYTQDSVTWYEDYATTIAPLIPVATGNPPPVFTIAPALPAGVSINAATGVISGTPTTNLDNSWVITATNSQGVARDTVKIFVHNNETFTNWTGTKTLTLNGAAAGITSSVGRYPLLVRLGAPDSAVFAGVGPGASSLRFTNAAGAPLHHEIETWDSAGRSASVWVLMDSVRVGNSTLNIRYGNTAAVGRSDGSAVFNGGSGFLGVWHMGTATGAAPRANSVSPGVNDATPAGNFTATMVPIAGAIGMADTLRHQSVGSGATNQAADDHFTLGSGYVFTDGQLTLSMWMLLPPAFPTTAYVHFLGFGNGTTNNNFWMGRIGSTNNFMNP
jgi:hypothetical protein